MQFWIVMQIISWVKLDIYILYYFVKVPKIWYKWDREGADGKNEDRKEVLNF